MARVNLAWCAIDWQAGIYSQAALQAVYFVLSAYGWWKWRGKVELKGEQS